jgi:RNA polymerase sigma-70 factor (ECF subfamily)
MSEAEPIAELFQRLQEGDPQAAARVFVRYSRQLRRLAEQHLSRQLAGRLDGEDIVQSVFRTFFRRSAQGEFHIDCSAQLWQLLVKITLRKAQAQGRSHTAERRSAGAEVQRMARRPEEKWHPVSQRP